MAQKAQDAEGEYTKCSPDPLAKEHRLVADETDGRVFFRNVDDLTTGWTGRWWVEGFEVDFDTGFVTEELISREEWEVGGVSG